MDYRFKHRTHNYKLLENNVEENLDDLGMAMTFKIQHPKAWSMEEIKLGFIKIKNFFSVIGMSVEREDEPHTERKYLQKTHMKKDSNPKFINNS